MVCGVKHHGPPHPLNYFSRQSDSHTWFARRIAGRRDSQQEFAKAVICTGARVPVPPIDGVYSVPNLTLTKLPKRLDIVGGGKLADAFARLAVSSI